MAGSLGIDIDRHFIRVALVSGGARRLLLAHLGEVDRAGEVSLADSLQKAVAPVLTQIDGVAVGLEGDRIFVRRLEIPVATLRQIADVLPFELEADLPVEMSELVHDHAILRRDPASTMAPVLAVAARTDDVRLRIQLSVDAFGREPERVVPGAFAFAPLAGLLPQLAVAGPVAVIHLEDQSSEVVFFERGEPVFARTISSGTAGLPASAKVLSRDLRQTISAFRGAGGKAPEAIYLSGAGAVLSGAETFLGTELEVPTSVLPAVPVTQVAGGAPLTNRHAKALGLALGLLPRARVMDVRRGPLAYERGYGFLRDRVPLLGGLAAVILVSFFFALWAEMFALGREKKTLTLSLNQLSQEVLGEATDDPQRALELLQKGPGGQDDDPLPHVDAFDVMIQLAQAVPENITHEIEELDVQRAHAVVHGIVPTIPDAQQIAATLKNYKCFQDVKIVRTNQVVGDDRQKYVLELDLRCPSDGKEGKEKGASGTASAQPPAGPPGDKP